MKYLPIVTALLAHIAIIMLLCLLMNRFVISQHPEFVIVNPLFGGLYGFFVMSKHMRKVIEKTLD